MGVVRQLKQQARARVAAASHGLPAGKLKLILICGQDGPQMSAAILAAMLKAAGYRVGVITQTYVEVAGERAVGSDQANVLGDVFQLHRLLADMKKGQCSHVIIEVPPTVATHLFNGLKPTLLAVQRSGDSHLTAANNAKRILHTQRLLRLHPEMVVCNRDDPAIDQLKPYLKSGPQYMTFGTHENAECQIRQVELHPKGSAAKLLLDHQTEVQLATHLAGRQAVYSAVTAAASAYLLQVPITAIEDGALAVSQALGSLQFLPRSRPYVVALDHSVSPDGLAENLEALKRFASNRVVAVVSGNLSQPDSWLPTIGELASKLADRLVICDGDYPAETSPQQIRQLLLAGVTTAGGDARAEELEDRREAFQRAMKIARRGDIIVVLSSPQRSYRQAGDEHLEWSDKEVLEKLLDL